MQATVTGESILLKSDDLFVDSCVIGPRAARAWPAHSVGQYARAGPTRMRRQVYFPKEGLTEFNSTAF